MSRKIYFQESKQIKNESWDTFIHFQATKLGLTKCIKCNEYKGNTLIDEEEISVSCGCSWIDCKLCKTVKIRCPLTNSFHKDDCKIWHTPYFHTICSKCSIKQ
jgi:hypothetical protein